MIKRRQKRHKRYRHFFVKIIALLCMVCWFYSQQTMLQMERIDVYGVPNGFEGFRIVHLSDLHGKTFGDDNESLVKKVKKKEPDIIVMTGDFVRGEAQFPVAQTLAKQLAAIAPTYYVTGNHEWAGGDVKELKEILTISGVRVLTNDYVMLDSEEESIALLGIDDPNGYADQKSLAQLATQTRQEQGEDSFLLLLSHRNNIYEKYIQARVDVSLVGHAHGGQIRLPMTDGLIGPKRELFPKYTAGRYDLEYGQMVVSRGLGNEFPAFRLFNRPHIPLVILHEGEKE